MITASFAGAAFIAVPPKRLKPKPKPKPQQPSQTPSSPANRVSTSSTNGKPLPNLPQSPSSRRSRDVDPALAIESLLLTRSRSSGPSSAPHPGSLLEIGEDEWTRDFVAGDEFLSGLCQEDGPFVSPGPPSIYETSSISPSSSSATSTIRAAIIADRLQTDESRSATRSSTLTRKLQPPGPTSHPSSSPLFTGDPTSSAALSSSHGIPPWSFEGGNLSSLNPPRHGEHRSASIDSGNMSLPTVRDINIAVVGAAGVGKTTFVERAYDLKAPPRYGEVYSLNMVVDRSPCSVSLVEVDWNRINFDKQPMQWPRVADGERIPFIDGVLLLYDATNPISITRLPDCLDAFNRAQLPVCVVRTKCDTPDQPDHVEISIGSCEQMHTSVTARDSQKRCMAAILSMISRRSEKTSRYLNGRRRANSSAANSRAASPRPSTAGHNRASSEFSSTFLKDGSDAGSIHGARLQRPPVSMVLGSGVMHSSGNTNSSLSSNPLSSNSRKNSIAEQAPQITLSSSSQAPFLEIASTSPFSIHHPGTSSQSSLGESERRNSYLDTDDDESTGFKDPDDIPILEREDALNSLDEEDKPTQNRGWTWDELINRLLSQPMSRSDQTFDIVFLCFYRKFATPRELLTTIIEKFHEVEAEEKIRLSRITTQLRYCNTLHQWATSHPGDFANPKTRKQLMEFLDTFNSRRIMAVLTEEIAKAVGSGVEDEDEGWGRSDMDVKRASIQSFLTTSSAAFPDRTSKGWQLSLDSTHTLLQIPSTVPSVEKRGSESSDTASTMGSAVSTIGSASTVGSALGLATNKTELLPSTSSSIAKAGSQFDLFMAIPVMDVASELTRIDWYQFSRIRPRDIVRHISLPPESRESLPNLAFVNNMISHFNHVACWVASVILEKPKPKHRARALEKFMEIAWALRHQNNYNSLGAVIAGINGTAVHRLSMTRELVRPEVHKNFMRLELLMGTHKSHSKYRLAWENTTSHRIPFLPLHRRDLVSAEEGNRTFLQDGEKINWNKFQVMGDVMMVLMRSQEIPYTDLRGNAAVDNMIKNASITMNDDELYERSVQLESSASGSSKPRRNWFQLKNNAADQR